MSKDTEGKSEEIMDMESKVLWYPDSKRNTQMDKFRIQVNGDYGLNLANYNDLYQWSVDNYSEFWAEVWRFCGVVSSNPYDEVSAAILLVNCHLTIKLKMKSNV